MKTFKIILLGFFLFSCYTDSNSFQQTEMTPEKMTNMFFKLYTSEGADAALDYILSTNQWVSEEANELKSSFQNLITQLGTYQGNELIVKRSIGENYILWSYMIRYDRQPLRLQFVFYRPSNKWQLQNFIYDDDLETELIEAANAYRLVENLPGNE